MPPMFLLECKISSLISQNLIMLFYVITVIGTNKVLIVRQLMLISSDNTSYLTNYYLEFDIPLIFD